MSKGGCVCYGAATFYIHVEGFRVLILNPCFFAWLEAAPALAATAVIVFAEKPNFHPSPRKNTKGDDDNRQRYVGLPICPIHVFGPF